MKKKCKFKKTVTIKPSANVSWFNFVKKCVGGDIVFTLEGEGDDFVIYLEKSLPLTCGRSILEEIEEIEEFPELNRWILGTYAEAESFNKKTFNYTYEDMQACHEWTIENEKLK